MLRPALLLLLAAGARDEGFPLAAGHRWTYERDGRESLVLAATGSMRFGETETILLKSFGGSFLGANPQFLTCDPRGLLVNSFGSKASDQPQILLPFPLQEGRTWKPGMTNGYPRLTIQGRVVGREVVEVPAGRFEAWRIDTIIVTESRKVHDLAAWFAPGTGFVRFDLQRIRIQGVEQKSELLGVHRLKRFERETPPPAPRMEGFKLDARQAEQAKAWLVDLGEDSPALRERATRGLESTGWGVAPLLWERRAKSTDAEVRGRIDDLLRRFPRIQAIVRARAVAMKVGETPPVDYRLKNVSPLPVRVLPCLHQSDIGRRDPTYGIGIVDQTGLPHFHGQPRCGNINMMLSSDILELEPGEEVDPFEMSSHEMLDWKPTGPGRYTFRFFYETGERAVREAAPELGDLLKTVHRGRFESNAVTIDIAP